jgi:hypothetical protein
MSSSKGVVVQGGCRPKGVVVQRGLSSKRIVVQGGCRPKGLSSKVVVVQGGCRPKGVVVQRIACRGSTINNIDVDLLIVDVVDGVSNVDKTNLNTGGQPMLGGERKEEEWG